ncbi:MAG: GNAT family N-acetyltransferase [Elusimicrobiales bacterium]
MEIEYRTPAASALPAVMGLMPTLYQEIGNGLPKVLAEFIEDKNYFKLLATEKGTGAAAGFMVGCCRLEVDFECRVGIIEEIVVHPDRRKLGIGRTMLAEFEKWAAARGAEGILVPCGREGFYEKMGFEMFPVKRYWKELRKPS